MCKVYEIRYFIKINNYNNLFYSGISPVIGRGSASADSIRYNVSHNICIRPATPLPQEAHIQLLCGQWFELGSPPPTAQWMFNGGDLSSSHTVMDLNVSAIGVNGALTISYVSNGVLRDASSIVGIYHCSLVNDFGSDNDSSVIGIE